MDVFEQLSAYTPYNEQEAADKAVMLDALSRCPDVALRSNLVLHLTASAWITNRARDRVLMIYHNIYDSWAWTGGHADGETDLLAVALREAKEETGLREIRPVTEALFSIETLTVNPHRRRGAFVPAHLHLNATYLLEADDLAPLCHNPAENSAAAWFALSDAVEACSEPWMRPVYRKLNEKLKAFGEKQQIRSPHPTSVRSAACLPCARGGGSAQPRR
ncbi:MAG: NUDIX hydrolase [Clostridia bacterium]|nr:NUDIX hydrolase [Clostridia bacterium]